MSLFYEFEQYFGFTELCKIETTYRFHQPLIDRSSEFIVKNAEQKVKTIKTPVGDQYRTYLSFEKCDSDENGVWQRVPYYQFDDPLPYGHGEKSVYIISGFMRLSREEAFAIRYHMGFSGEEDARTVGQALAKFPLAFALNVADSEATYFLEDTP